jgi:hypothetical protein
MTRAPATVTRLARLAARAARLTLRPLFVLVAVRASVALVGHKPTAAVASLMLLAWGLRSWVRLERRLDAKRRRPGDPAASVVRHMATSPPLTAIRDAEHVAFARALVEVSARYLAHCEDQAHDHTRAASGEAWR